MGFYSANYISGCTLLFPPWFTGESDAAKSCPIVSMHAGHRFFHRGSDWAVIQKQQLGPVRHIHLAQQIPADRRTVTIKNESWKEKDRADFYLDFNRTISAPLVFELPSTKLSAGVFYAGAIWWTRLAKLGALETLHNTGQPDLVFVKTSRCYPTRRKHFQNVFFSLDIGNMSDKFPRVDWSMP